MARYADEYVRCIPAVCAGNVWRKAVVLRDTTCSVCVCVCVCMCVCVCVCVCLCVCVGGWVGGCVSVGVLYNPVWAPVALCCTPTYELMNLCPEQIVPEPRAESHVKTSQILCRAPSRVPRRAPTRAPSRAPNRAPFRTPSRAPSRAPSRTSNRASSRAPNRAKLRVKPSGA